MKNLSRSGRRLVLLVMATALGAFSLAAVAFADDVHNDVDTTIDTDKESRESDSRWIDRHGWALRQSEHNGDGKNGCNSRRQQRDFSVSSRLPQVASVSPEQSVTFTACGELQRADGDPASPPGRPRSRARRRRHGGGSYNTDPAAFTRERRPRRRRVTRRRRTSATR